MNSCTLMATHLPCVPLLWISELSELGRDHGQNVIDQGRDLVELMGDLNMWKDLDQQEPTDSLESQPRMKRELFCKNSTKQSVMSSRSCSQNKEVDEAMQTIHESSTDAGG